MHVAVTGASGTVGRMVVKQLLAGGHTVVAIDRTIPPLANPDAADRVRHMIADVRDFGQVVGALSGCDAVIHLAAHLSPRQAPEHLVYTENTAASYHVLAAAATLGITRVCLASSINAIGGVFSRAPRYDYFPLDEQHPTYNEDAYSLSKWVLEQQADTFARRYAQMTIACLRFHWVVDSYTRAVELTTQAPEIGRRHLWAYTLVDEAARACILSLSADYRGSEAFYIVGPRVAVPTPSAELAAAYYPDTPLRSSLEGLRGFFDCRKAERILGWVHSEADRLDA